jgi:hypothetical protein
MLDQARLIYTKFTPVLHLFYTILHLSSLLFPSADTLDRVGRAGFQVALMFYTCLHLVYTLVLQRPRRASQARGEGESFTPAEAPAKLQNSMPNIHTSTPLLVSTSFTPHLHLIYTSFTPHLHLIYT